MYGIYLPDPEKIKDPQRIVIRGFGSATLYTEEPRNVNVSATLLNLKNHQILLNNDGKLTKTLICETYDY